VTHNSDTRIPRRARRGAAVVHAAVALGFVLLAACRGETPISVHADASELYWSLQWTSPAITIDSGGTQEASAIPRTYAGQSLDGLPAPTYTAMDTSKVSVSASGAITGKRSTTTATGVIASLTVNGVTHVDTAIVVVTGQRHSFKSFSIHPPSYASTSFATNTYYPYLTVTATDSNDVALRGLAVKYVSLAPAIANFISGSLYGYAKGPITVVATTTSYGTTRVDTVTLAVTNPMTASEYCYGKAYASIPAFYTNPIIIGVGGTVTWSNYSGQPLPITFDDSTRVTGGNIPALALYGSAARTFPTAGTFVFRDNLGDSAKVIVVPN